MVKATLRTKKTDDTTKASVNKTIDVQAQAHTVTEATVDGALADVAQAKALENDAAAELLGNVTELPDKPSTAVATRPTNTAVGFVQQQEQTEGVEGAWGKKDLKFPQLKIVQGSGKLSRRFNNGTIILDDEKLLAAPSVEDGEGAQAPPLVIVPLILNKQYREKLSQDQMDDGQLPRIARDVAEVESLGGTTEWPYGEDRPDNYWEESSRNVFLVQAPADTRHNGFNELLDGNYYSLAVYYAAGAAFRKCPRIIYDTLQKKLFVPVLGPDGKPATDSTGHIIKRKCIYKCFWNLSWLREEAGKFNPWRPSVLIQGETGPEVREYCANLLQMPQVKKASEQTGEEEA